MKHTKNDNITSSVVDSLFDLADVLDDASVCRPFLLDLTSDAGAGVKVPEFTSL